LGFIVKINKGYIMSLGLTPLTLEPPLTKRVLASPVFGRRGDGESKTAARGRAQMASSVETELFQKRVMQPWEACKKEPKNSRKRPREGSGAWIYDLEGQPERKKESPFKGADYVRIKNTTPKGLGDRVKKTDVMSPCCDSTFEAEDIWSSFIAEGELLSEVPAGNISLGIVDFFDKAFLFSQDVENALDECGSIADVSPKQLEEDIPLPYSPGYPQREAASGDDEIVAYFKGYDDYHNHLGGQAQKFDDIEEAIKDLGWSVRAEPVTLPPAALNALFPVVSTLEGASSVAQPAQQRVVGEKIDSFKDFTVREGALAAMKMNVPLKSIRGNGRFDPDTFFEFDVAPRFVAPEEV
jgi:hypothetical protein